MPRRWSGPSGSWRVCVFRHKFLVLRAATLKWGSKNLTTFSHHFSFFPCLPIGFFDTGRKIPLGHNNWRVNIKNLPLDWKNRSSQQTVRKACLQWPQRHDFVVWGPLGWKFLGFLSVAVLGEFGGWRQVMLLCRHAPWISAHVPNSECYVVWNPIWRHCSCLFLVLCVCSQFCLRSFLSQIQSGVAPANQTKKRAKTKSSWISPV